MVNFTPMKFGDNKVGLIMWSVKMGKGDLYSIAFR